MDAATFPLPIDDAGEAPRKSLGFYLVLIFRVCFFTGCVWALDGVADLGTAPGGLVLAAGCGVVASSYLAFTRLRWPALVLVCAGLWAVHFGIFFALDFLQPYVTNASFRSFTYREHVESLLGSLTIAALSTWFFWRARHAITLEALILTGLLVALFAAHRNYNLDRPRFINGLAWTYGYEPLTMFIVAGAAIFASACLYLAVASFTPRPVEGTRMVLFPRSRQNYLLTGVTLGVLVTIFFFISRSLYNHFNANLLSRVANGVGQGTGEDMSPLGFHSALGGSSQPAALVRLEGDYSQNPWTPMLYMRESALSGFNGKVLVQAGRAYDTDLPGITPKESFTGKEDSELGVRVPVIQSIYTLANQEKAFAVDYPVSIVQLKNPKPDRFRATYRAYSVAPAFSLSETEEAPVGDPRWSPEVVKHYVVPHPDPRYKDLAIKLTESADTPVRKMNAIVDFLSRTAIYTLTPNHDVAPDADPVAPFLFGDKRGYCVHFAHAIVYMARAIGIPARIGTGYLTDLSQAKDGHILLRMSDRHAWAEVFVAGYGWLPFDVKPDQVESHAETQVDMKLLEELMGMLDPGEEILPKSSVKDEPNVYEPPKFSLPSVNQVGVLGGSFLAAFALLKLYLWYGWLIPGSAKRRSVRMYQSVVARLRDCGFYRLPGETRLAYAERLRNDSQVDVRPLTHLVIRLAYADAASADIRALAERRADALRKVKELPWWRRLLAVLNPRSVISLFEGSRW